MTFNVLFPSGKVKCYFIRDIALMYCRLYDGRLLDNPLDNVSEPVYNDSIVNELETV